MDFDFTDYIVVYDRKYTDGSTFRKGAFKVTRQPFVPIIFSTNPKECLGHAVLEYRDGGVVAKCKFSDTSIAQMAKTWVVDQDLYGISFIADGVKRDGNAVTSGWISAVIVCPWWDLLEFEEE